MKQPPSVPETPSPPAVFLDDIKASAQARIPKAALDYYQSGAMDEVTLADNERAFRRLKIRPRHLRDVTDIRTDVDIFGQRMDSPICIAPTAMQRLAHPDGELGTARAAATYNSVMCLSTYSTTSLEDVRDAMRTPPDSTHGQLWLQVYVTRPRSVTEGIIRRAEQAGYAALVLTIDTPFLGRRLNDVRNKFGLPPGLSLGNFIGVPGVMTQSERMARAGATDAIARAGNKLTFSELLGTTSDTTLTWESAIAWFRSISSLPVLVKGVLSGEDAAEAVRAGFDGIIVSNHGGRQLDTVPATILCLEEVVNAANAAAERTGRALIPVFMDGGIRRGSDAFKALALGARAVFVGRPALWGLAHRGTDGVKDVLRILNTELKLTMALAGTRDLKEINTSYVKWEDEYYRKAKL